MSPAVTVAGFRPAFRRRLVGFSPREVLTFFTHFIRDHERTVRQLKEAQRELQVFREDPTFRADDAADRAQRIPLSTQQVAEVIERRARADADKLLADARTRATDVIRDAERRATRIIEVATRNAASLEKHMLEMRNHCLKLRAAFEHTAETQLVAARIGIPEASVSERN